MRSPALVVTFLLLLPVSACDPATSKRSQARAREDVERALDEASRARAEASSALAEAKQAKAEAKAALDKAEKVDKALQSLKTPPPEPTAPPQVPICRAYSRAPGAPKVTFSDRGVAIDGKLLGDKPRVADLEAALGKADRVAKVANDIHVYEKLGIIAYQTPKSDRIVQVTVVFAEMPWVFMPKSTFRGELVVQGARVEPTTKLTDHDLKPKMRLYVDQQSDCLATAGVGFNAE